MTLGQEALLRWTAPEGPWTEPDLHLFPQDGHRYEIVDGCLHVTPPLDPGHEAVAAAVLAALRPAAPAGFWPCARIGVQIGASNVVPDVAVLRPGSSGAIWTDPRDVILVVEVETPATRRFDRLVKADLYAEAGIRDYWRIERQPSGATAHLYRLGTGRRYELDRSVQPGDRVTAERPYAVQLAPATWSS